MALIVSFSGGRTSGMMAYILKQHDPNCVFIFANTSKENQETLDFVQECDERWGLNVVWVEAVINEGKGNGTTYKVVDYNSAARKGEVFAAMNEKYGTPNKHYPHCTRELKEQPIKKWVKNSFGCYQIAIGIRADERIRINRTRAEKESWVYPLVDWFPTTKRQVLEFWDNQNFDLAIPDYLGNCDLCWKKSIKKRIRIISERPEIADWWENEEIKSEYVFDRDGYTIGDLRKMAKEKSKQTTLQFEDTGCSCFSNIV